MSIQSLLISVLLTAGLSLLAFKMMAGGDSTDPQAQQAGELVDGSTEDVAAMRKTGAQSNLARIKQQLADQDAARKSRSETDQAELDALKGTERKED